jgi:MFS family permease
MSLWLLRVSIPADSQPPSLWLERSAGAINFALSLIPFAGIGFLWFVGVVRDRLGHREDRLFATVFLGSGLLFLAMLFLAAALVSAMITSFAAGADQPINEGTFRLLRLFAFNVMNIYAVKMAGVFMLSTSTVAAYTGFVPRYMALIGQLLALVLLLASSYLDWSFFIFPLWVLMISTHILVDNFHGHAREIPKKDGKLPRTQGRM